LNGPVTLFYGTRRAGQFEFAPEDAHHLSRVLRHRIGDRIWALDGESTVYLVELEQIEARIVVGKILSSYPGVNEPAVPTILLMGAIGQTKMDWLVEKATELGATTVQPLSGRPRVGPGRLRRWQRIARSAAKQCRRACVPAVNEPEALTDVLAGLPSPSTRIIADPGGQPDLPPLGAGPIVLAVGPEKGFDPTEREALLAAGFQPFTLGGRRLRAETAAVALLAIVVRRRDGAGSVPPWARDGIPEAGR